MRQVEDLFVFNPGNFWYWTIAFMIFEYPLSLFYKGASESATEWYSDFPVWQILLGDYTYTTVGFILAQKLYEYVVKDARIINPDGDMQKTLVFLLLFTGVQWTGDFTFSQVIHSVSPDTKFIRFFQKYAKKAGWGGLLGDTSYIWIWTLTMIWVYTQLPEWINWSIAFFFLFVVSMYMN